jgi:hypothetical protein
MTAGLGLRGIRRRIVDVGLYELFAIAATPAPLRASGRCAGDMENGLGCRWGERRATSPMGGAQTARVHQGKG